jgi:outer membrane biosynthesis protein TonB
VTAELGELNRKARTFPQPIYPRDARLAGIQGKVIVRIIVDASTGDVVWAQAQSGPVELREPALTAACMAAFFPTMDVDSKVGGFLAYTFGKRR